MAEETLRENKKKWSSKWEKFECVFIVNLMKYRSSRSGAFYKKVALKRFGKPELFFNKVAG